jgi:tRNA/rRNA methyltransferase
MNCRVVLVRPEIPANIGAVARIMANMGLAQLVLVAPVADPADRQARLLATHGECVLEQCTIVGDLGEALGDCLLVVGTSSRLGGPFRQEGVCLPDQGAALLAATMKSGPTALVFGPERTGLENCEVTQCHHLISIPANPTFPALNLGQAAAICLYELRKAWLQLTSRPPENEKPALFAEQERMFNQLRSALEQIHFLYDERADAVMHALRHLIGRAQPTTMEVGLLFGLARQIHWFAQQDRPDQTST